MSNQVINMNIGDVIPYEKNPRFNDKAVDAVANSITMFGFKQPIVVDKDNIIIVGHTRLKAAQKLGLTEVPVMVADDLDDDQVNAYRLADNRVGELSEWDMDTLREELDGLSDSGIDMESLKFDESFLGTDDSGDELPAEDDPSEVTVLGLHVTIINEDEQFELMSRLKDEGYDVQIENLKKN